MLYYMPYHEYEVYSAIFCIIRPVPDVSKNCLTHCTEI